MHAFNVCETGGFTIIIIIGVVVVVVSLYLLKSVSVENVFFSI